MTIDVDRIPEQLRERAQWVVWRLETLPDIPKPTKIPYNARDPRYKASSTNKTTWSTFDESLAAWQRGDDITGIGYVFSGEPDDYCGVDLDDCLQDGKLQPWRPEQRACKHWRDDAPEPAQIVAKLATYTEVSPSGNGVKLIVRGDVPINTKTKHQSRGWKRGDFEVYQDTRYFTVTGRHLEGTPATIADCNGELTGIVESFTTGKTAQKKRGGKIATPLSPSLDDRDIIDRATKSQQKFAALFGGSTDAYPSASEADSALACLLAFWTRDAAQIERLMRQSGLNRDKWDSHGSYLADTIAGALNLVTEHYGNRNGAATGADNSEHIVTNARPSRDGKGVAPLSMAEVLKAIGAATGGFPRSAAGELFVFDSTHGYFTLKSSSALFGWLASRCRVDWHRTQGCISKEETFAEIERTVRRYKAVEMLPHQPPIADHFYACPTPSIGDGSMLRKLLDRFQPATPIDGDLILASLLTPFWGGRPGGRPCFVFTTDDGRGVGKTTAATMLAQVADHDGDVITFEPNDDMSDIKKRLLSPGGQTKRVAILDNVKQLRFSWGELEGLITMPVISGHKMYVGEGSRPNTLTWFVTLNGASLSTDMSQRAIIIKLAKPKRAKLWEDETREFIHDHRQAIIGDLLGILRAEPGEVAQPSRWASWEREVLARLPEPNEAQAVYLERQGEVDAEGEAGDILEQFVAGRLANLNYDVDRDVVFIPSTVMAQWYSQATGERHNTTGVSKIVRQMIAERQLRRIVVNPEKTYGRGFLWFGNEAQPDAPKQNDIGTRLRLEKQDK